MKIYAYKNGSKSAKALAGALGAKLIKHDGAPLNAMRHVVINWGCSHMEREFYPKAILNVPYSVAMAVNKLLTFEILKKAQVSIPDFTTSRGDAINWIRSGVTVMARTQLNGHSGQGIEILEPGIDVDEEFVEAPMYTKYIKKNAEYRVHVFGDEAFFVQKKARKLDVPDDKVNWKVRNLNGGFIYAHQNVEASPAIIKAAIDAIAALGLDFGAVDIIEKKNGECFVLEVNTACGLEGTTLEKYVEQFKLYEENHV